MLFDEDVPEGFQYRRDFIDAAEEIRLIEAIAGVEFGNFEMRGAVAKRRVAFFGGGYDAGSAPAKPMPAFLLPLRERLAGWACVDPDAFSMALINEYPAGAPIGWHRDAPQYEIVTGLSLLSACRMKFRPYVRSGSPVQGRRTSTHAITLEPRSAYLMTGVSRHQYEHHIPAVASLRYSVTFRTRRAAARAGHSGIALASAERRIVEMPDPRERRGDERTSRMAENEKRESGDRPDRPGQPGDLETRDRGGRISKGTPDQAEGEREDGE